MKPKIALVDDDSDLLFSLAMTLEDEGFEVRTFTDSQHAWHGLRAGNIDLAVLDIMMPRMDGVELLRRLRRETVFPVIFLTSKIEEEEEALGLGMGADDYIKKPFSQALLIARIRASLRRREMDANGGEPRDMLIRGDLVVDCDRHECTWKGKPVRLTVTQFLILKSLARRVGYKKTRDQLIGDAYGADAFANDRAIDSHIKRMRTSFRAVDPGFSSIETVYGGGYRFRR